ncbi:MAG: hypothetical protein LBJ95_04670 [Oscillospiraceae bacterium]|jgi:hypothetical protein|nr:hypothetical protein [Oscillospiraceae bacterium]
MNNMNRTKRIIPFALAASIAAAMIPITSWTVHGTFDLSASAQGRGVHVVWAKHPDDPATVNEGGTVELLYIVKEGQTEPCRLLWGSGHELPRDHWVAIGEQGIADWHLTESGKYAVCCMNVKNGEMGCTVPSTYDPWWLNTTAPLMLLTGFFNPWQWPAAEREAKAEHARAQYVVVTIGDGETDPMNKHDE